MTVKACALWVWAALLPVCAFASQELPPVTSLAESEAISAAYATDAKFLSQAKPCAEARDVVFCSGFGLVTLRFSEAVFGDKDGSRDFAVAAVTSVVASDGGRWDVNAVVRVTPSRYALIVVPQKTQSYLSVMPLTFDVRFADRALFDARGSALPVFHIVTTEECCGNATPVNLNFGAISIKGAINGLVIGRTLFGVESASTGVSRLEGVIPSNLPFGFRLLSRSEKEAVVGEALQKAEAFRDLDWYFDVIDEHFTAVVVQRAINAARDAVEVMAVLSDLSNNDAYEFLSHTGQREAASALLDLRGTGFARSLARANAFAGANDAIRAGGRSSDLLVKIRGELVSKSIDQRYFEPIASAISRHGDAPDGIYSRVSVFDSVFDRETYHRQIHCKPGDTYYRDGRCRIDGP
jgi:hypothetical protein